MKIKVKRESIKTENFSSGLWGGFWLFICYSTFHFLAEIWTIFCEPNLKYSEWEKFDTEELLYHRVKQFVRHCSVV